MGEELENVWLSVVFQAVDLDPSLVVNVAVFLLGCSEKELIVEEANISGRLTDLGRSELIKHSRRVEIEIG